MRLNKDNKQAIERQLKNITDNKKSITTTSRFLGTTRKTVSKWLSQYQQYGELKLKNHVPTNAYSSDYNENIINLYKGRLDKLKARFGEARKAGMFLSTIRYFKYIEKLDCSMEHIRKVLKVNGFVTHRTQSKTKKAIKKQLKLQLEKTKNFDEANELKDQLEIIENHDVYHAKSGVAGFRTEADGCFDHWFGKEKHCLYFIIDSFTGVILDFWIEDEETNIGYLNLFKNAFKRFGKSVQLRTDMRNGLAKGAIKDFLLRLGINHSSSTDPKYKPNVERAFEDAQALLPNYFMDNNINSPEDALARKEEILTFMNQWLKREMPEDNLFQPLTEEDLEELYIKRERVVANEVSHISIDNKKMAPFRNNKRVLMHKKVVVYTDENNQHFLKNNTKILYLKEIKDVIQPKEFTDFKKKIEFEKSKSISYHNMLRATAEKVNKKIAQINRLGFDVDELDIAT